MRLRRPGPVDSPGSRGSHALIKDGAQLVEVAEDVVEGLGSCLTQYRCATATRPVAELSGEERTIVEALSSSEACERLSRSYRSMLHYALERKGSCAASPAIRT